MRVQHIFTCLAVSWVTITFIMWRSAPRDLSCQTLKNVKLDHVKTPASSEGQHSFTCSSGEQLKLFFIPEKIGKTTSFLFERYAPGITDVYTGHDVFIYWNLYRNLRTENISEAHGIVVPFTMLEDNSRGVRVRSMRRRADAAANSVRKFVNDPNRWIWLLGHDFGRCLNFGFTPSYSNNFKPYGTVHSSISLQPNGDRDLPCFDERKSIVIPARPKMTRKLLRRFNGIPKNVFHRRRVAFFAGTSGYGELRKRFQELVFEKPTVKPLGVTFDALLSRSSARPPFTYEQYLDKLENSQFCLIIRGIVGWTFRLSEAIYAGSIPVIFGNRTHYPWENILDYNSFSVRIPEQDIEKTLQILSAIEKPKLMMLFSNLFRVREAFVFNDRTTWTSMGLMCLVERELLRVLRLSAKSHGA